MLVPFEDGDLLRQHYKELRDIQIRLMRNTLQNEITRVGMPRYSTSTDTSNISTATKKERTQKEKNERIPA
jgi:hypothetical protein